MKAKGLVQRIAWLALALLALAFFAARASALEPKQVLVVANSASKDSVSLAKAYLEARGIPEGNLLEIKTTTKYTISRDDYEKQVRQPIEKYLLDKNLKDQITCIVVMYEVPVRIEPSILPKEADDVYKVYKTAASRTEYRLAIDHDFLKTVGVKFPEPKTQDLTPLAKLFDSPGNAPQNKPKEFPKEIAEVLALLAQKHKEVARLEDADKQRLAYRQLMAIYLDIAGLQGLRNYVHNERPAGAPDLDKLDKQIEDLQQQWAQLHEKTRDAKTAQQEIDMGNQLGGLAFIHGLASHQAFELGPEFSDSALDSELALLWYDNQYNPGGWINNPMHWQRKAAAAPASQKAAPPFLMTSRIDGPSKADALRIITASASAEKTGLKGTFYIDAGGLQPRYDQHLTDLAAFVKDKAPMKVVLETTQALFPPNSCPDTALYVGWYSLRRYVPAFAWNEGAVGWHIASFEAMHLRDADSQEWCVKMLQNGVAATVGAVNEPFLGSFPLPEEFFPLLMTGKYTLAECYWRTTPYASWRLTLIGDPLYNPFAKNPQVKLTDLPRGLAKE